MPQPEDIFQSTDPKQTAAPPVRPVPSAPVRPQAAPAPHGSARRWLWPAIGGFVLVIGIGVVVVLRLRQEPATTTTANSNVAASTSTNTPQSTTSAASAEITGVADADKDGLLDDEETQLGTKVDLADTDRDGLGDGEEVRVYKSDPKRPDTDGDGNRDGAEVQKGYNPTGTGVLLNFTEAREALTK